MAGKEFQVLSSPTVRLSATPTTILRAQHCLLPHGARERHIVLIGRTPVLEIHSCAYCIMMKECKVARVHKLAEHTDTAARTSPEGPDMTKLLV